MRRTARMHRFFALALCLSLVLGVALPAVACAREAPAACHDAAPSGSPCDAPCCTAQDPAETAPAQPLLDRLPPQPDLASGADAVAIAAPPVPRRRAARPALEARASGASSIPLHVLHAAFLN